MLMATLSGASLRAKSIHFSVKASSGVERSVLAIENLAFCAGEQIALCGPSGSGKTTLLNVLLGLKLLPGADISWDNIKLSSLSPSQQDRWRREHVGIVFQQFHLHPKLSPIDNVLLSEHFGALRVSPAIRLRAQSLLDQLNVPTRRNTEQLSRGEMQRVALARAFLRRPRIFIADEPTASLDVATAKTSFAMLSELCREAGTTAIITTHDQNLAATLDRRLDLKDGLLCEPQHGICA